MADPETSATSKIDRMFGSFSPECTGGAEAVQEARGTVDPAIVLVCTDGAALPPVIQGTSQATRATTRRTRDAGLRRGPGFGMRLAYTCGKAGV